MTLSSPSEALAQLPGNSCVGNAAAEMPCCVNLVELPGYRLLLGWPLAVDHLINVPPFTVRRSPFTVHRSRRSGLPCVLCLCVFTSRSSTVMCL